MFIVNKKYQNRNPESSSINGDMDSLSTNKITIENNNYISSFTTKNGKQNRLQRQ